jgi:hypothetical protein
MSQIIIILFKNGSSWIWKCNSSTFITLSLCHWLSLLNSCSSFLCYHKVFTSVCSVGEMFTWNKSHKCIQKIGIYKSLICNNKKYIHIYNIKMMNNYSIKTTNDKGSWLGTGTQKCGRFKRVLWDFNPPPMPLCLYHWQNEIGIYKSLICNNKKYIHIYIVIVPYIIKRKH